jgi:hypothetical protein
MTDGHPVEPSEIIRSATARTNPLHRGLSRLLQDVTFTARACVNPNIRLIKRSGLFDAKWYSNQYAEVKTSGLSALNHYLTIGWRKGFSPGPNFDASWYLKLYRDVEAYECEPLLHYLQYGRKEGRLPKSPNNALIERFLSLGDNCEFGLVQRYCGGQTVGLFNFAETTIQSIIGALETRLGDLLVPTTISVNPEGREYILRVSGSTISYHLAYHTMVMEGRKSPEQVRAQEVSRLAFLARKFIEDLEDAEKIFVFKSDNPASLSEIRELGAALRKYGPNSLLWVTLQEPGHPVGSVEILEDRLLRGYIDRFGFSPYGGGGDASVAAWLQICANAHRLWSENGWQKGGVPRKEIR